MVAVQTGDIVGMVDMRRDQGVDLLDQRFVDHRGCRCRRQFPDELIGRFEIPDLLLCPGGLLGLACFADDLSDLFFLQGVSFERCRPEDGSADERLLKLGRPGRQDGKVAHRLVENQPPDMERFDLRVLVSAAEDKVTRLKGGDFFD